MFSKTLIKLIDYSIFPAFLIIGAKILSVVFLISYFNADYQVAGIKVVFSNPQEYISINTYSSVFMYMAILAGLAWVVVKAHIFHDTHISPSFSSRLFSMNLEELIHTTEIVFSQAFIWLSYAWISTVIFAIYASFGLAEWWLFYGVLGVTLIVTSALAVDIEREINADKDTLQKSPVISPREKILKFEQLAGEFLS